MFIRGRCYRAGVPDEVGLAIYGTHRHKVVIFEGINHADLSAQLYMKIGTRWRRLGGRTPGSWFMFIRGRCYRAGVPDGVVLATES